MQNTALKTDVTVTAWQDEISKLVAGASSSSEQIALRCFEKAMSPLFQDPERLRTMLGKIMQVIGADIAGDLIFSSEEELQAYMRAKGIEASFE